MRSTIERENSHGCRRGTRRPTTARQPVRGTKRVRSATEGRSCAYAAWLQSMFRNASMTAFRSSAPCEEESSNQSRQHDCSELKIVARRMRRDPTRSCTASTTSISSRTAGTGTGNPKRSKRAIAGRTIKMEDTIMSRLCPIGLCRILRPDRTTRVANNMSASTKTDRSADDDGERRCSACRRIGTATLTKFGTARTTRSTGALYQKNTSGIEGSKRRRGEADRGGDARASDAPSIGEMSARTATPNQVRQHDAMHVDDRPQESFRHVEQTPRMKVRAKRDGERPRRRFGPKCRE